VVRPPRPARGCRARAKNYDGSWTEYGSLVGVPIELGV
jgi:3-mercaptopyruvate sulfurtransferase SseA